jgi:hypothetical protein
MCTQVESEMLEPILVGDNDAYKRKIARRDAQLTVCGGFGVAAQALTVWRCQTAGGFGGAWGPYIWRHCLVRDRCVR